MNYKYRNFNADLGFHICSDNILKATEDLNQYLTQLPPDLFPKIDFKTTGALIGALFCSSLVKELDGAIVNPIEKGYPDIIPACGANADEQTLRNYPHGLEIKCTTGSLKSGIKLQAGMPRIDNLSGITWQAHHRDGKSLMGIVWDFINFVNNFYYPAITAVYYSDRLTTDDWGSISGTTGRNTKVTGLAKSGKQKMNAGGIIIINNDTYINRYNALLG